MKYIKFSSPNTGSKKKKGSPRSTPSRTRLNRTPLNQKSQLSNLNRNSNLGAINKDPELGPITTEVRTTIKETIPAINLLQAKVQMHHGTANSVSTARS
jgi:hypothetical protein